ncbi:MAG: polysaccharide deacetylase family protein [Bacillota bacterium]
MLMRTAISYILIFIFCILVIINPIEAEGYNEYNIVVNNEFARSDVKVEDINGIIYVPLEPIKELLGVSIVRLSGYTEISFNNSILTINDTNGTAALNNDSLLLDYPLVFKNNTTYLPLIYIVDIMLYKVEILDDIKHIRIITKADVAFAGEIIDRYFGEMKAAEENDTDDSEQELPTNNGFTANTSSKKVAYLTFDDGIDKNNTPRILDILKEYDVKATFFILGNTIEKNKDILKRMNDEGHSIGNHSFSHKKDVIYSDINSFKEELKKTDELIYEVIKKDTRLFRPPYGATYIKSDEYKEALKNYKTVLWNVDSKDSSSKRLSSSEIFENVRNQVDGKSSAIIIMHDGGAREETIKALPDIIEYLLENGFDIKPIYKDTVLKYEY